MKRISLLVGLSTLLLLGACGSEEASTQSVEPKENPVAEDTKEAEPVEEIEEPEITELDVEVVEETTYAFVETSTDLIWASYYAEVKNNSEVPVNISSSSVVYTNEAGDTTLMVSDMGLKVHPRAIMPGETAFVSIYDPIQDPESFSETFQANIEFNTSESTEVPVMHETENVKVIYNENGDFSSIRATGTINVVEDQEILGYSVAVAMYDAEGNFLGILEGGSDEEIVSKGKKISFDIENPPFPPELMDKVVEWKAVAYSNGL